MTKQRLLENVVHLLSAQTVDIQINSVPAAGPTDVSRSPLHARKTLGAGSIVIGIDCAQLSAKSLRRKQPHLLGQFGIITPCRRQWVDDGYPINSHPPVTQLPFNTANDFTPYVARPAIANSIAC